ncbi:ABC transporter permease [Cellulomonas sp. PhB143]|uniref:ABC transporter permease n=1 Tax=Cellulomonas sp. PhB143 TaxID=2485186 RepID=UPI000F49AADC|nr:ABC transporter permease [Cellulomonas sp. PhB143]ROS76748.1 monosaccharide ABC transporter membrane protein (CUT2 family) [Cellulomonas sp. PhB143]
MSVTMETNPGIDPEADGPVTDEVRGVRRKARAARFAQQQGALVVLVLLVVVMSFAYPTFASAASFSQIALQASFLAIVALGMTLVIFTGGIDLSVGSVFALGGVVAAWASQYGVVAAIVLPLVVCGAIGLVQGLIIARGGLPPFIVTLAGLLFARGLLLFVTDEGSVTNKVPTGSAFLRLARSELFGVRYTVWLVVVLVLVGVLVQTRTTYGATLLAIGSQEEAAVLMGMPVDRVKVMTYVVSGMCAGLAGLLTASYTASGVTTLGVGMELTAISAVVLGGTLLTGGAGSVVGTVVGVLLLQVIANLINRLGLTDSNWQAVTSGAVLLVVATSQQLLRRAQRV